MTTFKGTSVNAEKGFKDRVVTPGTGASIDNLAQMVATSEELSPENANAFDTGIQLPPHARITGIQIITKTRATNAVQVQIGSQADTDAFLGNTAIGASGAVTNAVPGTYAAATDVGAPVSDGIDQPLPIWAKLNTAPGAVDPVFRIRILYTRAV